MAPRLRTTAACLICLIVSLLLVGVVSGTLVSHSIQAVPAGLVVVAIALRPTWAPHMALAIFVFWFAIMILIWLWLLGIAAIVAGHFDAAEVVLTLIIGASSMGGVVSAARVSRGSPLATRISMFALFVAVQIGAMWLSFREAFSRSTG